MVDCLKQISRKFKRMSTQVTGDPPAQQNCLSHEIVSLIARIRTLLINKVDNTLS